MIKQFERLTRGEYDFILKAPALISLVASYSNNEIDENKKNDAFKLAHLKTFTANPILIPYYKEVEKNFRVQFEELVKDYCPLDEIKLDALKQEIKKVDVLVQKLNNEYAVELSKSLKNYARHVERGGHSVFQDFIFPIPIPGLSE